MNQEQKSDNCKKTERTVPEVFYTDGTCIFNGYTGCTGCGQCNTV